MKSWERDQMMFERGMRKGIEESIRKGMEEGVQKGIQRGKRKVSINYLLELLSDKGSIPVQVETIIRSEQDLETLNRWFRIALKASSVEEFVISSGLEV